jgi:hypothetical protein
MDEHAHEFQEMLMIAKTLRLVTMMDCSGCQRCPPRDPRIYGFDVAVSKNTTKNNSRFCSTFSPFSGKRHEVAALSFYSV